MARKAALKTSTTLHNGAGEQDKPVSKGDNKPPVPLDMTAKEAFNEAEKSQAIADRRRQSAEQQYCVTAMLFYLEQQNAGTRMPEFYKLSQNAGDVLFSPESQGAFLNAAMEAFGVERPRINKESNEADLLADNHAKAVRQNLRRGIELACDLMTTARAGHWTPVAEVLSWYDAKRSLFVVPLETLIPRDATPLGSLFKTWADDKTTPQPLTGASFYVMEGSNPKLLTFSIATVKYAALSKRGKEQRVPMFTNDGKPMLDKNGKQRFETKFVRDVPTKIRGSKSKSETRTVESVVTTQSQTGTGAGIAAPGGTGVATGGTIAGNGSHGSNMPGFQTMLKEVATILSDKTADPIAWGDLPADEVEHLNAICAFVHSSLLAEYQRNAGFRKFVEESQAMMSLLLAAQNTSASDANAGTVGTAPVEQTTGQATG